jgi:hypothetical protein
MLSPLFQTGPDQIVVQLKPHAADAPANLLAPAAPGGPLAGFALPPYT